MAKVRGGLRSYEKRWLPALQDHAWLARRGKCSGMGEVCCERHTSAQGLRRQVFQLLGESMVNADERSTRSLLVVASRVGDSLHMELYRSDDLAHANAM